MQQTKKYRLELEMKILRYRQILRIENLAELTQQRINELIARLERKLREMDE